MNTIPAAMMLRKPSWLKEESKKSIAASEKKLKKIKEVEKFQNTLNQNDNERFNKRLACLKNHKVNYDHSINYSSSDISSLLEVDIQFLRRNCGLLIKLLKNINPCEDNVDDDNMLLAVPENILQNYFEDLCTLIENIINDAYTPNESVIKQSSKYSITGSASNFIQRDCKKTKM